VKKIIHLSDLHIGYKDCDEKANLLADRLIERIDDPGNHVIVITGDLVDIAFSHVSVKKTQSFISKLEKSGFTVLVAPGNHDYGVGALGFRFFVNRFKKWYFENEKLTYPKVDIISSIVFIGLDSNAEELHLVDRIFAEGELGKKQLDTLDKILNLTEYESLKKVVYLHHHPWDPRPLLRLKDSEDLRKVVEDKIDVLLFGHLHEDEPEDFNHDYRGFWGIERCYNAGTSTFKAGNAGRHIIIDLGKKSTEDMILNFLE